LIFFSIDTGAQTAESIADSNPTPSPLITLQWCLTCPNGIRIYGRTSMSHIFISYSRKDLPFAQRIVDALASQGLDTWIDWKSIPKGEDWEQEIYRGIEEADAFLFMISPDSVQSEMCKKEIADAVKNGKRIIPIVIRDTDLKIIPTSISKLNWIFGRNAQDDFSNTIEQTRKAIQTDYEWVKYHTNLQVKALEWERRNDSSRLLRGKELKEAEEKLANVGSQKDPQPTELQHHYIFFSRRNEEIQNRRFTLSLAIVLIIVAVLAIIANRQRNLAVSQSNARSTAQIEAEQQAKISRAGELAAQSINMKDVSFDLGLLLSDESFYSADTFQTRNVLLSNAQDNPQLLRYFWAAGSPIIPFDNNPAIPISIAISPDGKTFVTSNQNGLIIFWNVATYQPIGHIALGDSSYAESLAFSPDGKILASGNSDHTIILWDATTLQSIGGPLRGHNNKVSSVVFNSDGRTLASSSTETASDSTYYQTFILWDVSTHHSIGEPIKGMIHSITNIYFSSGDQALISVGYNSGITIWDFAKQRQVDFQLNKIVFSGNNQLVSIAISPDGKTLAIGTTDGRIFLWSISTHELIGQPLVGHTNWVLTMAFSSNGKVLASGDANDTIILWDLATQEQIGQPLKGYTSSIVSIGIDDVIFSSDGSMLLSRCSDGSIIFWSLNSRQAFGQVLGRHTELVTSVAFSPNGKILASGSYDHTIILWDITTGQAIGKPLIGHSDMVTSVAFSPDGKTLASGSCSEYDNQRICVQSEIIIWDVATHQPIGERINVNNDSVKSLAFTPDGKTLTSGGVTVILWDMASRQSIGQPLSGFAPITSLAFSPDGKSLAAGTYDGSTILWNLENNRPIGTPLDYVYNTGGNYIAFSPDGKTLASETFGSRILFLDPKTLERIGETSTGQTNNIYSLAFSPDGKILASGSYDKTIVLWDVATRQEIGQPLIGHTDGVNSVAFSPDGKILASGSDDKTIMLWPADPPSWVELNCQRAGRNFTQAEWQQYFPGEPYHITCPQWPTGK